MPNPVLGVAAQNCQWMRAAKRFAGPRVALVAGVDDELIVDAELDVRGQSIVVVGFQDLLQPIGGQRPVADEDAKASGRE